MFSRSTRLGPGHFAWPVFAYALVRVAALSLLVATTAHAAEPPRAEDFVISVTDASDIEVIQIFPRPRVGIGSALSLGAGLFDVSIVLEDAVTLGALGVRIDYSSVVGEFVGAFGDVACNSPFTGATAFFSVNDDDARSVLDIGVISLDGFRGPTIITTCRFAVPFVETTTTTSTSTTTSTTVAISTTTSTTTTSSTTTSTTVTTASSTTTSSTTTTTLFPGGPALRCRLVFSLTSAVARGTLAFQVNYADAADGSFTGSGTGVDCRALVGDMAIFHDDEAVRSLSASLTSTDGFAGPTDIARCMFDAALEAPSAADFLIEINEQDAPGLTAITAAIEITDIICGGRPLGLCGDAVLDEGETCDDGEANSDNRPDACRSDCRPPRCGDAIQDSAEECDDGNTTDGDGCSAACMQQAVCGDANGDNRLLASDTLAILAAAVGLDVVCPRFICDIDSNGAVTARDGLAVLRAAVGLSASLVCRPAQFIHLRMISVTEVSAIELEIDYSQAPGELATSATGLDCTSLITTATGTFTKGGGRVLHVLFEDPGVFVGPRSIAECRFDATGDVTRSDFAVTVLSAVGTAGASLHPPPTVRALPY